MNWRMARSCEQEQRGEAKGATMLRRYHGRSAWWCVLLVVLCQCAPLLVYAARSAAHDRHNHRLLADTTQQACQESVLILPAVRGEVVQNRMAIPANISGPGVCVMVTGAATLLSLSPGDLTLYQATGSITFWWPGANTSVCNGGVPAATTAVEQFYVSRGLVLAGATGGSITCCTDVGPCDGTDFNVLHSPSLSAATPPSDWADIRGYAFDLSENAAVQPYLLSSSLYNNTLATQPDAASCQGACASVAGCASYLFDQATSACTFYQSEPGGQLPLVPCSNSSCQFGFRIPGSCGMTASQGISHIGKRWPGWQPGLLQPADSEQTDSFYDFWGADTIPPEVQGLPAATVSECSCRCTSVGNCVGYTWLANNQTCWLLNNIQTMQTTEDDPDPGTVLGRVVTGGVIPPCNDTATYWTDSDVSYGTSERITRFPPLAFPMNCTYIQCYRYCTEDPACQAAVFVGKASYQDTYVKCWLLSEVSGGFITGTDVGLFQIQRCEADLPDPRIPDANLTQYPGWSIQADVSALGNTTYLALLTTTTTTTGRPFPTVPTAPSAQDCFQLCRNIAGCGVAIYNPHTTTCFPAYLVGVNTTAVNATTPAVALQQQQCGPGSNCLVASREPGSCGLIASSGVLQLGQRWAGWAPDQDHGTWGQAWAIEPENQNTTVQSVSDCACQCQNAGACIAYMYFGDVQRCWLQNRIEFSVGYEVDPSPVTVAGRLAVPAGMLPNCSKQTFASPDSVPYTLDSTRVQRRPNPFPAKTTDQCNEACLIDPFCVAFVLRNASAAQPSCQLYSSINKRGFTVFPNGLFGLVQRCAFVSALPTNNPPTPLSPVPPSPLLALPPILSPAPSPASSQEAPVGDQASGTTSSTVGIAVGATCGGVAILGIVIAGLIWRSRSKKRAYGVASDSSRSKAYQVNGPGKPEGKSDLFPGQLSAQRGHSAVSTPASAAERTSPFMAFFVPMSSGEQQLGPSGASGQVGPKSSSSLGMKMNRVSAEQGSTVMSGSPGSTFLGTGLLPAGSYAGLQDLFSLREHDVQSAASESMPSIGVGSTSRFFPHNSVASLTSMRASSSQAGHVGSKDLAAMTGLLAGDPFLMSVAPSYRWSTDPISDMVAVEEGINAGAFTAQQRGVSDADAAATGAGPDPVQLTTAEVQQQVELMANGMIDRGATAVVFKCRWASRFGPNALLAIKCMRDPYAYHMSQMLESFKYEVEVLCKCRHPNVVRIYGYCLEPPVVCVILELLPGSLKDRLYGSKAISHTSINPWARRTMGTAQEAMLLGASSLKGSNPAPIIPPATPPMPTTAQARSTASNSGQPDEVAKDDGVGPNGRQRRPPSGSGHSAGNLLPPMAPQHSSPARPPHPGRLKLTTIASDGSNCAALIGAGSSGAPVFISNPSFRRSDSGCSSQAEPSGNSAGGARACSPVRLHNPNLSPQPSVTVASSSPQVFSSAASTISLQYSNATSATTPNGLITATSSMMASQRSSGTTPSKSRPIKTPSTSTRSPFNAGAGPSVTSHEPHVFPIAVLEVLQLGADVAAGLAHLHSKPEARLLGLSLPGESLMVGQESAAVSGQGTGYSVTSVSGKQGPASVQGDNEDTFAEGQAAPGGGLGRVVHRDLKPANILINSLGRAKISDFGLAREHQNTTVYTQHYGAGTLSYMAPELLKGAATSSLTDKVDIYGLGIMLWELATRQLPWKNCSDVQVQALVTSGQRPPVPGVAAGPASVGPPSASGSSLGGACNDEMLKQLPGYTSLVRACWQAKPHRRPAAAAVHKALQKLVDAAATSEAAETAAAEAAQLAAAPEPEQQQ